MLIPDPEITIAGKKYPVRLNRRAHLALQQQYGIPVGELQAWLQEKQAAKAYLAIAFTLADALTRGTENPPSAEVLDQMVDREAYAALAPLAQAVSLAANGGLLPEKPQTPPESPAASASSSIGGEIS